MTGAAISADRATPSTLDAAEVEKFARLAEEWWNPSGKMAVLHKFNPVRLAYIRRLAIAEFGLDEKSPRALAGLRVLDIGCGGGLLSEPLARMGAEVVGIDPAATNVETAKAHAVGSGVPVDYRQATAEELAAAGEAFDIVLAMEVVEHVADVDLFVEACARLVKPGGLLVMATINRTMKSYALAIVGAEYVLRWLPRGTHQYGKLVRPEELDKALVGAGLSTIDRTGVIYNPLADRWQKSRDMDVNYMVLAEKAA